MLSKGIVCAWIGLRKSIECRKEPHWTIIDNIVANSCNLLDYACLKLCYVDMCPKSDECRIVLSRVEKSGF